MNGYIIEQLSPTEEKQGRSFYGSPFISISCDQNETSQYVQVKLS